MFPKWHAEVSLVEGSNYSSLEEVLYFISDRINRGTTKSTKLEKLNKYIRILPMP